MYYQSKSYDLQVNYDNLKIIMELDISYTDVVPDEFVKSLNTTIKSKDLDWFLYNYLESSKDLKFNESYLNLTDKQILIKHWSNEIIKFLY